jgi:hypothetical protein
VFDRLARLPPLLLLRKTQTATPKQRKRVEGKLKQTTTPINELVVGSYEKREWTVQKLAR